jgi:hypothetical protein
MWRECDNKPCAHFDPTTFVVGRYSCPLEAGNRIMKFLNHLVWAIITDRVFLWGYWGTNACLVESATEEIVQLLCSEMVNSAADCKEILKLASWVPSWDEWSLKLNLTQPIRASAIARRAKDPVSLPMDGPPVPRVIRVGQQVNLELGLIFAQKRAPKLLRRIASKRRAEALFGTRGYQGVFFTHGMLFEALFSLHPSLLPTPDVLDIDSDGVNSYALHSRHQQEGDDGHSIDIDESCMNTVLFNKTVGRPCIVYTMTDRLATKQQLPEALAHFNCTAIFSKNTTAGKSRNSEHGPFAGRGYYEDLAIVRNARQGFMAPNLRQRPRVGPRTSSSLPRSIIEFRRVLESPSDAEVPGFRETFLT